jgi:diaminopimelate decarboxylase
VTTGQFPLTLVDGRWQAAGRDVEGIVANFGTPLFLYNGEILRSQYGVLRKALPDVVDIYYSIKANPNPAIVRFFAELAAGLEVASAAEYEIARKAGAAVERILFAGPGKTSEELAHVVGRGIGELHVESSEELAALETLNKPVNVSVRFNPAAEASGGAMRMGGKPSQFGFDEEEVTGIIDRVRSFPCLQLRGLHMFAGTQILDAEVLVMQWAHGIAVARKVAAHIGEPLKTVDFGGGLGIPYFQGEKALDLSHLGRAAVSLFSPLASDPLFSGTRFIVEPGRFLAGPAGVYITRVISVKRSRGARFVVVDGGMNHHLAASGNLGQVIKKDFPIHNLSRPAASPVDPAVLVGPLCTPLDTLGRRIPLPETAPGDLIAVMQSGAYGLSASPVGFLSHRMPAEVLVNAADIVLIRSRGSFTDPSGTII